VRVLAVERGLPSRIELRADWLDAPGVTLVTWQSGALRRFTPPAPGATTVVAWTPGPTGLF